MKHLNTVKYVEGIYGSLKDEIGLSSVDSINVSSTCLILCEFDVCINFVCALNRVQTWGAYVCEEVGMWWGRLECLGVWHLYYCLISRFGNL